MAKSDSVSKLIKQLGKKVDRLEQTKKLEELEGHLPAEEAPDEMNMLKVDTQEFDMFGDPIGLITGSRLHGDDDAYNVAHAFVIGKYHRMLGNRYGKHSILIKKEYFDDEKIDPYLLSAFPHRAVTLPHNGEMVEFYKIRMLITDMQVVKLLLTRIPTGEGLARKEQIMHVGAKLMGLNFTEHKIPIPPDYIPSGTYGKVKKAKETPVAIKAAEQGFSEDE